ncbi:LysR substrate-binding domain-containing protein [Hydrogenophaga sp. 5NK40-0174]
MSNIIKLFIDMENKSTELRHLRYFLVLAEELHFGRAAQRLSMTQPPLSLSIQQLEASIGARLFERNNRGVALTAAGQALQVSARALLEQADRMMREARDVGEGMTGSLEIGFAGTVLYLGLPDMLRRFEGDHPRLRVVLKELSSSDQLTELMHDRLDVGFVHTTRVPAGFEQIKVSSQPFMACLPSSHPMARRRRLALSSLKGEPFALVSRSVSPDYHDRLLAMCAGAGFDPELRYVSRHWLSVVSLVGQGLGVALVPASLKAASLPGAKFVPLAGDIPPYETYCLWKTSRSTAGAESTPALGAFVQAVRASAQAV